MCNDVNDVKENAPCASPDDARFMAAAITLAKRAAREGEVPVGAVVVRNGVIVGAGRNRRESGKNALAHAELRAIDRACKRLGGWRLWECDLYVTMEPCPMCAGAIMNARIRRVVYGCRDPKAGAVGSLFNLYDYPVNHKPEICGGVAEEECGALLSAFFADLRIRRKQTQQTERN